MKLREEDKKKQRVSYAFIPHPSYLILCFVVLCGWTAQCVVSAAESGVWVRQRSPSLAWLKRVRFLDARQGWVAGSNGTLLRTVDGGARWEAMPRPTRDNLRDVWFTDANHGWLLCEADEFSLSASTDPRSYILRTTNGGATWTRTNPTATDPKYRLIRFVFVNERTGWTFGEAGLLYNTNDAGATWTKHTFTASHLIFDAAFLDAQRGWLVGGGGTIWRTTDAGATWRMSKVNRPVATTVTGLPPRERDPLAPPRADGISMRAIAFADSRRGWVVGTDGEVWTTADGGGRWTWQESSTNTYLSDVAFFNAHQGWIVGRGGTILHTANGGVTWTSEVTGTEHFLESVAALPDGQAFAVGFGGTILRRVAGNGAGAHPRLRTNR